MTSAILPAYFMTNSINGQPIEDVIYFDRESPIMIIARDRKQLITFDNYLLNVPKQQNTQMNIIIKNYVMVRLQEIKLHKLTPVITFEDVFKKCRIDKASSDTKMNARNAIIKFMQHMKSKLEIKDFESTKQQNSFHSVKFSYAPIKPQVCRFTPRQIMKINENSVTICKMMVIRSGQKSTFKSVIMRKITFQSEVVSSYRETNRSATVSFRRKKSNEKYGIYCIKNK